MAQFRVPVLEKFEYQQNVKDKDLATPPGSPVKGDRYIVAASATGAWIGQEKNIAWYDGAIWKFDVPTEGWQTWVMDEDKFYFYNGSAWSEAPQGDMNKSVYDTDNDGRVDKAEAVDDGVSVTSATQVKEAYDKRGTFDTDLNAVLFNL